MTAPVPEVPDRSAAIAADVALIADSLLAHLVDIQGDPPSPDREYWTRVTVARAAVRLGALTDPGLLANLSTDREVRRHGRALLPAARLHADLASYTEGARVDEPSAGGAPSCCVHTRECADKMETGDCPRAQAAAPAAPAAPAAHEPGWLDHLAAMSRAAADAKFGKGETRD